MVDYLGNLYEKETYGDMKNYVKPELEVKSFEIKEDIALKEYQYTGAADSDFAGRKISLFSVTRSGGNTAAV